MFAGIDIETGKLHGEAFGDFEFGTGKVLSSHPLSGLVFKGFQIPFFQQAKQTVLDAAKLLPRSRVIGWDVCIKTDGAILLEGNSYNNLYNLELSQKGHLNNPVFQELLNEIDTFYNKEGNNLDELKKKYPLFT